MLWLLTGFIGLEILAFVHAQVDNIPVLRDNVCPSSAWILESEGFRYAETQNSPLKPYKTFVGGHTYLYVYSHIFDYGHTLYFHGLVADNPDQFRINIVASQPVDADNAPRIIQFNPRFNAGFIAFNTYSPSNGGWGHEERCPIPKSLKRLLQFVIKIHVTKTSFRFIMNGHEFYAYNHRVPANIYGYITVFGDVELRKIRKGGPILTLPFKTQLNDGLAAGDRLFMSAVGEFGSFNINFFNKDDEMVLQFVFDYNRKDIICYQYRYGAHSIVSGGSGFPMMPAVEFNIDFIPSYDGLTLALGDVFYGTYKHPTDNPQNEYYAIQIENSVTIFDLEICPHK